MKPSSALWALNTLEYALDSSSCKSTVMPTWLSIATMACEISESIRYLPVGASIFMPEAVGVARLSQKLFRLFGVIVVLAQRPHCSRSRRWEYGWSIGVPAPCRMVSTIVLSSMA